MMKKEFQNFEDLENFLKKHNASLPKTWKSKFIKKNRKERDESKWKDCRICLYAEERVNNCSESITSQILYYQDNLYNEMKKFLETKSKENIKKFMKKHSLKSDSIILALNLFVKEFKKIVNGKWNNVYKKGGKSYYKINFTKEYLILLKAFKIKKLQTIIKLPTKKETIKNILKGDSYWDFRSNIIKLPKNDRKNQKLVRDEIEQYYKQVCNYVVSEQDKYNKVFFQKHQAPIGKAWNRLWKLYLKVR